MKKQINLSIFLVCPVILTTLSCADPRKQEIDTIFGEEQAKEMTMIYYLDYDKIVNQNLEGKVENLTPEKIVEEMKKEPIIIDFYNRSDSEFTNPVEDGFPIKFGLNSMTDKYNEVTISHQIVTIKLVTYINFIYFWYQDVLPEITLQEGLSWVSAGTEPTKWGPDRYMWAIQMIKEVKLNSQSEA